MPARFKTFKALLGDSVDRPSEKPLFVEPCDQPNFFEACHPPAQRAHDHGEHLVRQQLAELIETNVHAHSGHGAEPAHRMFRRAQYSPCNTSLERSFANNVQPDSASGLIDLPSPEVALDPILVSEKQHRFVPIAAQTDRDGTGHRPTSIPVCRTGLRHVPRTVA